MVKQILAGTLITAALTGCHQLADQNPGHSLELVFADSVYQLTGVAKQDNGKLLVNYPAALRNWNLDDAALEARVQDLGNAVTTDGMIFDKKGNLYMGDLQRYRIIKIDPSLAVTVLVKDQRLIWPDSYSIADGYLYLSCSQIQKQPEYNNGVNKRTSPYTVYRFNL